MREKAPEPAPEPVAEPVAELLEYPKMLYVTPHRHQIVVNTAEEEARVLAEYEPDKKGKR